MAGAAPTTESGFPNWKQPFSFMEKCSFLLAKTVCRLLRNLTPTSDQRCSNGKKEFHHWHSVYNTLSKPCSLILESKAGIQLIVEQGTWWVRTLKENRLLCFGFFPKCPFTNGLWVVNILKRHLILGSRHIFNIASGTFKCILYSRLYCAVWMPGFSFSAH